MHRRWRIQLSCDDESATVQGLGEAMSRSAQWRQVYQEEARTLGEIGAALRAADLEAITVRLPRALADRAATAWERPYEESGTDPTETVDQRVTRHRAGTLALIGLAVIERGHVDADGAVVVDLDPELVGVAMDTADDTE